MNFGFNPPDPQKLLETLNRLKDVFQRAADADSGPQGTPLFQSLSNSFNHMVDQGFKIAQSDQRPSPQKLMMSLMPTAMVMQNTISRIRDLAGEDPRVADTLNALAQDLQAEVSAATDFLPPLGGMIPPWQQPTDRNPPAAPPPKKPGNKGGKKPPSGDFDL